MFCLPYAGGNASFFNRWKGKLDSNITLVPIEYKGHGVRMGERLIEDVSEMIEDICCCILDKKHAGPFALFGYSMGAKLCVMTAARLFELTGEQPEMMFLCASTPPHILDDNFGWENDDKLTKRLSQYGGMPSEVLQSKELCDLFFPIIKADFSLCSKIRFTLDKPMCDYDLFVLYSPVDDPNKKMEQWRAYTTAECRFLEFDGTHFFIKEYENEILMLINSKFARHL